MKLWQSQIPQLSTDSLIQLALDAEHRIGSHVAVEIQTVIMLKDNWHYLL
jgi:hypothetical protein